jgi:transcriptional regulator GlxA family with amidase domain
METHVHRAVPLLLLAACSHKREIEDFPAKVGIVLTPDLYVTEASAPWDIYQHAGADWTDVYFVAETMDPVVGYYGEKILPDYTFDDAPQPDVLVVPSGAHSRDTDLENEAYIGYIRDAAKDAAYVTSHCWGAFALAAAGILDGRKATTFPGYTKELHDEFPDVEVVDDQRWVQDDYVITSNGGLAAYEASTQVVEQILGKEAADEVAAGLVLDSENLAYVDDPKITAAPSSGDSLTALPETKNVAS